MADQCSARSITVCSERARGSAGAGSNCRGAPIVVSMRRFRGSLVGKSGRRVSRHDRWLSSARKTIILDSHRGKGWPLSGSSSGSVRPHDNKVAAARRGIAGSECDESRSSHKEFSHAAALMPPAPCDSQFPDAGDAHCGSARTPAQCDRDDRG